MKKILSILILLVGFVTPTLAEKEVADKAIRCSALIYIQLTRPEMAGLTAGEALMNRIYAYHMIDDNKEMEMTNGQITAAQTDAITKLTQEYIQGANLAEEYRGCVFWMTDGGYFQLDDFIMSSGTQDKGLYEFEIWLESENAQIRGKMQQICFCMTSWHSFALLCRWHSQEKHYNA